MRTHFSAYLEMPAINEAYFGRKHRYVYGYKSDFDNPQIGIAKVGGLMIPAWGCMVSHPGVPVCTREVQEAPVIVPA